MNVGHLINYLTGAMPVNDFKAEIASEVAQFKSKKTLKENTVPIYVENDTIKFEVRHEHIKRLCADYLAGALDEWDLHYIADVIDMAQADEDNIQFDDEEIYRIIFALSTPEINYPIGSRLIRVIKNWLDGKSSEKFDDYLYKRMANKELKKQYKHHFKELRTIINEWDPYSLIAEGAPIDEFEAEVGEVLAGLSKCKNQDDTVQLISQVFSRAFEPELFKPEHCSEIGGRIFNWYSTKNYTG